MSDELESFLTALHTRTSLEELLDWDYELTEYLVGAWANVATYTSSSDRHTAIALLVAQLPPAHYEKYQEKLEKWISDNYNMFVR